MAQAARRPAHRDLSGPGLRAFFRIADLWGIGPKEQEVLLGTSRTTLYRWRQDPDHAHLSQDTLERISYILNIYGDLQIVLPRKEAADSWVKRPNTNFLFGGRPPLQRMLGGRVADLFETNQYTSAWRGGKC